MNWFMLANELIQHSRNTSIATAVKIHERYYLLCMHCFVYTCLLISVHQVSVKLTLNAIIILRGCTIDRVMIKATHETSEDKVR